MLNKVDFKALAVAYLDGKLAKRNRLKQSSALDIEG
ncbi:hypothetical protein DFP97_111153 [Paenibacillus prosopidis]|uniref:Uncharacterized protein n=1 Tax=Paenibacillus prosopidis TaxID=630520 RepID=A0A368VT33_9BACL|nr:hypothetical protein DFP97_111153 [Paenibacillus prosopidis]